MNYDKSLIELETLPVNSYFRYLKKDGHLSEGVYWKHCCSANKTGTNYLVENVLNGYDTRRLRGWTLCIRVPNPRIVQEQKLTTDCQNLKDNFKS